MVQKQAIKPQSQQEHDVVQEFWAWRTRFRNDRKSIARYCNNCKQTVKSKLMISWLTFIFLLFLGIFPGFIYLAYCGSMKKRVCPTCNDSNWKAEKAK